MDAKDQALENQRVENEKLRREVEYQKLKVAGYERLLEIVKHEDGIAPASRRIYVAMRRFISDS